MRRNVYLRRSLSFHWRSHVAVGLGVVVATTTLTGALLVGDSMRGSLLENAVERLGRVDFALHGQRFVTESLVESLRDNADFLSRFKTAVPAILVAGGASHPQTGARSDRITILGVDDRFWKLANRDALASVRMPTDRTVVLNQPLATQLGVQAGDDVLLRMGKADVVPTETLLGRRDDTNMTLRLKVVSVVPAEGIGAFSLNPRQARPHNAWVPLHVLQRSLKKRDRINAILLASGPPTDAGADDMVASIEAIIKQHLTPVDLGVLTRQDTERGYLSVEAESMLLEPSVEQAAIQAAAAIKGTASPMLTYLANEIAIERRDDERPARSIPYSTVTALDTTAVGVTPLTCSDSSPCPQPASGEILINAWAAERLNAGVGDRIALSYYVTGAFGELETRKHSFVLRGIVRMDKLAADPGFTPEYEGVTNARNLADWDPPFPMNLDLVRDADEDYWDRFKATPKAFISLAEGRKLWTEGHERFGRSTCVRIVFPKDRNPGDATAAFVGAFVAAIDPAQVGLVIDPIRQRLVESSVGSTDFGMLFVSFSFFLIASACMLIALLFRLGVEQRSKEIGILLATGYAPKMVRRLLLTEGAIIAVLGGAVGLAAAGGFAWLMLTGLRIWWSAAANAPFLSLHVPAETFVVGYVSSFFVAMASVAWSIRGMTVLPAGLLLSGSPLSPSQIARPSRHARVSAIAFVSAMLTAILMILAMTDQLPQTAAFFGSGAALMVACLAAVYLFAVRIPKTSEAARNRPTIARLGLRNAMRNPRRSLLTVALIASATFLITALEAFRLSVDDTEVGLESPTGGFTLYAESAASLPFDLNTVSGRTSLGFSEPAAEIYNRISAIPFRLRPGDEASCLNLYTPKSHRILGATDAMIDRGGFVFASMMDASADERKNPWLLLRQPLADGAIPVIGDANAVQWQLHSGLGKDLIVTDEHGGEVRLRFVALLSGSVLQDEIIIAESAFVRLFPSISGYAFHLVEVASGDPTDVAHALERDLARYSFDVSSIAERLAAYLAVQNTYLSTFQTLGGLGLVLGTIGLAVVLLRNVWERRGELALMRALGFSRSTLGWLVLSENIGLVLCGLFAGVFSALVAITPHILQQPQRLPWMSLCATVVLVLIVGIGGGAIALIPTLRTPLLPALRRE